MDVTHVAQLANLPLTSDQLTQLSTSLDQVMDLVNQIQELDTTGIAPTSQVTGLVNVTRPDVVEPKRVLSQAAALSNATHTQNGYFKVPAIFNQE